VPEPRPLVHHEHGAQRVVRHLGRGRADDTIHPCLAMAADDDDARVDPLGDGQRLDRGPAASSTSAASFSAATPRSSRSVSLLSM